MSERSPVLDFVYDENYYDHYLGELPYDQKYAVWRNHFRTMAEEIVERYKPKKTLDVGCAKGFLVEHLRALGVEAFGIDVSEYAISQVAPAARPHCRVASACEPLGETYDLITFIEAAEHMEEADAKAAVANLCAHAGRVLFSSSPSDFAEASHFNVHPREYWVSLFAAQGFYPTLHRTPGFVTPQAILFEKVDRPIRVAVFSNEPSGFAVVRLRLLSPLQTLERQGRVQLHFVWKNDPLLDVEKLLECDLFVIHREFANHNLCAALVESAKCLRKPLVFEIDDLLTQVPPTNPNHLHCAALANDLTAILRAADFVTVSTRRLGEELAKIEPTAAPKTHVLENRLDPELWGYDAPKARPRTEGPLVIGWMGTATHADDLAIAAPAIRYVLRKHRGKVVFRCWGWMPEELAGVEGAELARGAQPNIQKHAADLRNCGIDLAIAPLADGAFNHSKSNLKWLEYSICGIPGIYSKVTPFETSIADGHTGLLVENTTEAWAAALERMIADGALRARVARGAFEVVSQEYRLDRKAHLWDETYRSFVASGTHAGATAAEPVSDADRARAVAWLLFEQANRFLGKGFVDAAAAAMIEALTFEPALAERFLPTAERLSAGRYDHAACELLESIAAVSKEPSEATIALARHHESTGDPLRAEETLREGAARADADGKVAIALARLLARRGRAAEARPAWTAAITQCKDAAALVELCDELVGSGHGQDGLRALRKAVELSPGNSELEQCLADLSEKVGILPRAKSGAARRKDPRALSVAVFAGAPLAGRRVVGRLTAPLRALAAVGNVGFEFGSLERNTAIAKHSDVVLATAEFAVAAGEAGAWFAKIGAANAPLVLDVETLDPITRDPSGRAAAAFESWVERSARIIVSHDATKAAIEEQFPAAAGKVAWLPDARDLTAWPWRPVSVPNAKSAPLTVGYLSTGRESQSALAVLESVAAAFDKTQGAAVLHWWGPVPVAFQHHRSIVAAATEPATHREAVRELSTTPIDLALVPEAGVAGEAAWLDFAACHVACVVPPELASPTIRHGETAVVARGGASAWVQSAAALASEPAVRAQIAQGAWLEVVTSRSIQQNAKSWLELFQTACAPDRLAAASRG